MPDERFRGDPYTELGLRHDATNTQIKRRWRELAREHHPDRAAGDREAAARLTTQMARINAAYDLLRDPVRRAAYNASPAGRRARSRTDDGAGDRVEFDENVSADGRTAGPPPPPRTHASYGTFRYNHGLPAAQRAAERGKSAARPRASPRITPRKNGTCGRAHRPDRSSIAAASAASRFRLSRKRARPCSTSASSTATRSARSRSSTLPISTGSRGRSRATATWSSGRG